MQRHRDIQTPNEVADVISKFLVEAKMPFEPVKEVVRMDTVRDWSFDLKISAAVWFVGQILCLISIPGPSLCITLNSIES